MVREKKKIEVKRNTQYLKGTENRNHEMGK